MCTKKENYNQLDIKSLIKDYSSTVYESLLGIAAANKNLVVLENHCIIMRRDHMSMKGKVKIIGGGGSGIEPAEACYVGKGMLTAAVMGEIFTAPSADEILLAIRELAIDNPDGILLVVKNYIGDKLNFTLAMEQALNENITVKMLLIGDDIFCHNLARCGRKGLAGSVLVYKIVGELAEQGKILEEIIKEYNENVLENLATASVTLTPCSTATCELLKHALKFDELILGVGIYGKGGVKKIKINDLKDVVSLVLEEIIEYLRSNFKTFFNVVVLVNNLGSTTKLEEAVIVKEVSEQLHKLGFQIHKLFMGTFMTSMSTQGFSVSLLKSSPDIIKFLNVSTSALGWPKIDFKDLTDLEHFDLPITVLPCHAQESQSNLNNFKYQRVLHGPVLSRKATAALEQITIFAAEALISCEKQLNIIDAEAGDGDTGSVLKRGAEALKNAVINGKMDLSMPSKFLFELSEICYKCMTGLLGALYAVFFKAAAKTFQNAAEITPELCCAAFTEAVKALKHYGDAELEDRTILDVLYPALDSFESAIKHGKSLTEAVHMAAITCEFKSEETKWLKPFSLKYLDIHLPLLYADAGAHAATIWFRAISEGLKLHYPTESFESDTPSSRPGIFMWKFLTEEEAKYVLEYELSSSDLTFFIEKKTETEQTLTTVLLLESIKFCRKKYKGDPKRTSALVGTIYYTHLYFIASRWRTPTEVYFYFRESILRQSVESPPTSMEIFEPEEARDAVIFFFETYIRNLPIISLLHLPHYKLYLPLKQDKSDQLFLDREKITK